MIRRLVLIAAVSCVFVAGSLPSVLAAEKTSKRASKSDQVTQGEFASMLVNVLGLSRFLGANPSVHESFAALLENGISPVTGWQADKVVTRGDLARVIVQALGEEEEIKNPKDPKSWIMHLEKKGISIDTVGSSLTGLKPLPEPIAHNVASVSTDPLDKRHKFNPTDESEYGVDMAAIVRVFSEFELLFGELRVITPD